MLWSPPNEMPYLGRMPIYWITLFLYIALQVPAALSKIFGMLLAFRFMTGSVGPSVLAMGGTTVADMHTPKKRVYGMTFWSAFAVCASATAPITGGFSAHSLRAGGGRIWILMWLGSFTLIIAPNQGNITVMRNQVWFRVVGTKFYSPERLSAPPSSGSMWFSCWGLPSPVSISMRCSCWFPSPISTPCSVYARAFPRALKSQCPTSSCGATYSPPRPPCPAPLTFHEPF